MHSPNHNHLIFRPLRSGGRATSSSAVSLFVPSAPRLLPRSMRHLVPPAALVIITIPSSNTWEEHMRKENWPSDTAEGHRRPPSDLKKRTCDALTPCTDVVRHHIQVYAPPAPDRDDCRPINTSTRTDLHQWIRWVKTKRYGSSTKAEIVGSDLEERGTVQ